MEAPPGFEPGVKDLQSSALPLGHGALLLVARIVYENYAKMSIPKTVVD